MLDASLDAGLTAVDTANGYAGGESERILGELLRTRRDQVLLATKAGIPHPDQGDHPPLSPAGIRAALEGSLRRLGTDRV
jgi:aryl-alcohol dehydrogenase-like predicted oxidoreductase